ncbi:peptidase inhibitor family I36 protein [Actinomadura viridis]|uniref:Peptidase inhibitor family I36 n=1 Tax=Actinomadura viridis TaxID=58110 RepID=A0A931DL04_9ACTN|nr:peptidase inhibitor family I36 protein [Actinomadura viridis]MBG6089491.1 hypothetical protein [Actinomadura viridis]
MRHAFVAATTASMLVVVPLSTAGAAGASARVPCGSGQVCIYPQVGFRGTPYVRRASDGSVSLVKTPINDRTLSVINNGSTPRTARIYRSGHYSGSHTCIQAGTRIPDLRGYAVGQWGSSLKLNNDRCG